MLLSKFFLRRITSVCILVVLAGASASMSAQDITLQSNPTVVLVPTTVTDANGQPIHGLRASDFIVEDNGVPQKVVIDEIFEAAPISVVAVVQRDLGHAEGTKPVKTLGSMLYPLIGEGKGQAAVVAFDSSPALVHDFTSDTAQINDAMDHMKVGDHGAAILDAVRYGIQLLDKQPKNRRKILLLVSDTKDDGTSTASVDSIVRHLEASNAIIYTIAYTASGVKSLLGPPTNEQSGVNLLAILSSLKRAARENVAKSIAELSGGEYLPFGSQHDFEDEMAKVGNHYFDQYLLSFQPAKLKAGQHALSVRLRETDNVIIRSRVGYWVAGAIGEPD